jgi:hypothetical protein
MEILSKQIGVFGHPNFTKPIIIDNVIAGEEEDQPK